MIRKLAEKNRSYRRFYEEKQISKEELLELIDIARLTASGANKQPTRFILSYEREKNDKIFHCLRWAGYYQNWDGPEVGERPSGYILMISPKIVNASHDEGIIGQTILLAAVEKGMGGCFIANVDRVALEKEISIPSGYEIKLVLALGYPKEKVVIDEIMAQQDIKYYRDEAQNHHVPKIRLEDLIVEG